MVSARCGCLEKTTEDSKGVVEATLADVRTTEGVGSGRGVAYAELIGFERLLE